MNIDVDYYQEFVSFLSEFNLNMPGDRRDDIIAIDYAQHCSREQLEALLTQAHMVLHTEPFPVDALIQLTCRTFNSAKQVKQWLRLALDLTHDVARNKHATGDLKQRPIAGLER